MFTAKVQRLWDDWNLRTAVLVSLLFQVLLIVLANSRKTRGSVPLTATIWVFYLLADWVAAFAVGLISSGQTNDCPHKSAVNNQLAAFWAPFLLLHLGGPDAITAFSLEDNELWIRHLFGLVIQLLAVVYVFVQSLPNEYWLPMVLMILAGAGKYAERTVALYQACLGNFKKSLLPEPDPGPNYAQFMEEYSVLEASQVPVEIKIEREPEKDSADDFQNHIQVSSAESLDYTDTVVNGHKFFDKFKGVIVDHMFSFHERNESRKFFFSLSAVDAFKVIEVELNFMYDALYTKYSIVHSKKGYCFRFLCTALIVACLWQFTAHLKHDVFLFDRIVSFILLGGAVLLDLVSTFGLVLSDWVIVSAKKKVSAFLIRLPFGQTRRRWSDTVYQHSFISFCHKERFKWIDKIVGFFNMKETLDELQYKKQKSCDENLKEFVFNELKVKAKEAKTREIAKEIYSARGGWVLSKYPIHYRYPSISLSLSDETEYDETLLLWHIATELCYFTSSGDDPNRKFCKVLSDYMLYLLVMRPTLMSAVSGIAQIRFQDTCEEARKFFKRRQLESTVQTGTDNNNNNNNNNSSKSEGEKLACERLLNVKTVVKPSQVKGDRSKSLLFDACILANDLKKMGEADDRRRWEMMSRVWVEVLCYAGGHCRSDVHARQLNQGGELITFVWLQMVHFGLGDLFRIEAGHARAKLLVSK